MKDQYVKDIENQNYDLMKKLAEVQEILENYQEILDHNEDTTKTIIINLINELWYKVNHLHKFKLILEENDIPHDYDYYTLQQHSEGELVADKYMNEFLSTWEGRTDEIFRGKDWNFYKKYIEPYLKDTTTDESIQE